MDKQSSFPALHIGFSLVDLAMGGAQTFMVQLAQVMAQRNHRISYYLAADPRDRLHVMPELLQAMEATAVAVPRPRRLLACDVIHLDGYHSLRRKLPYLPVFSRCLETYHSTYSVRRSGPFYPPHRVAISQAVQALLPRPTHLIYFGVSLPVAPSPIEKSYDVAILGRIHPVKQHLLFLQICSLLAQQQPGLRVLLIGGHPEKGPYQQEVDSAVARLQAQGVSVHLTGDVPATAVADWLAQVRVLLVTSASEGFGRMAVEALACGVPVVANAVGGLVEIVQDGQTGFLITPNETAAFVARTRYLLTDEALRQQMGAAGHRMVATRFSLMAMADAYETLYRQIAARRP